MGRIAELDAEIATSFVRKEVTEDGDFIMVTKMTAESFDACRLAHKTLLDKCDAPRSNWKWNDRSWTFKDGKWETTFDICVDGIEYAIERSNDYHAWLRADPREEELERYFG